MTNEHETHDSQLFEDISLQFNELNLQLNQIKMQTSSMQQNMKLLEKNIKKKMKCLKKESAKTKSSVKKAPSGFAKPCKVTNELCKFMNRTEGEHIARTEVTRSLIAYIKENKLENETNSKIISPDDKLKELLDIEDGQELTYFNIQKYMNKHFVKNSDN